ncbi:hypothetical protein T02_15270 [Trichinella nativa]|uniref:Uncharacterized protein n=1 Tax=Trichinella nativa TaxID=6335 RepID=A0A0V1KT88_9BILA|nr:hypothetical protein T02_15270 [Trichinella nativa]
MFVPLDRRHFTIIHELAPTLSSGGRISNSLWEESSSRDGRNSGGQVDNTLWVEKAVAGGYTTLIGGETSGRRWSSRRRKYNTQWMEELAGRNTLLFGWKGNGELVNNYVCVKDRVAEGYTNLYGWKGMAGEYTILLEWRDWWAGIEFCWDRGNGGQVYNSVWMKGMGRGYIIVWVKELVGRYRILLGWRKWRAGIQFSLGGGNGEREFRSVIEFSMGGGGIGVRLHNSSWL